MNFIQLYTECRTKKFRCLISLVYALISLNLYTLSRGGFKTFCESLSSSRLQTQNGDIMRKLSIFILLNYFLGVVPDCFTVCSFKAHC